MVVVKDTYAGTIGRYFLTISLQGVPIYASSKDAARRFKNENDAIDFIVERFGVWSSFFKIEKLNLETS